MYRNDKLFDWRINAGLNHFYGDLKFLENEMADVAADNPIALKGLLERLDNIEQKSRDDGLARPIFRALVHPARASGDCTRQPVEVTVALDSQKAQVARQINITGIKKAGLD